MGTLVHDKPKRCRTFAEHCSKGFVLGTFFDHYRAWTMWMKVTRSTRVSATVFHKRKHLTPPTVTPADRVLAAAQKLSEEIKGRMLQHLSTTTLDHLERLSNILKQRMPQVDDNVTHVTPPTPATRRSPQLTTTVINGRIIAVAKTHPHRSTHQ